ncbi:MAG: gliding motility-associated C-terminal domain-containing protein [Bacteroidota bacterium]
MLQFFSLKAQPPPCVANPLADDFCASATAICNLNGYCGNTSATYTNTVSPTNLTNETNTPLGAVFCATIQNNSWLKFIADSTTAIFDVWCSNCAHNHGIQMQIYKTTNCYNFTSVSNCWNPGYPTNGQIIATGLIVGSVYYFMIDGTAGDNCDYVIACSVGVNAAPAVSLNQNICEGMTATVAATGGLTYFWTANPPDPAVTAQQTQAVVTVTPSVTTVYTVIVNNPGLNTFCATDTTILSTIITVNNVAGQISNVTAAHCNLNNGAITVAGTGGTGTYAYLWNTTPAQSTPTIAGLAPGSYTVTVSSGGCNKTVTAIVPMIPAPVASVASFSDAHCNQADGSAVVQINGGSAPFTYVWSSVPVQNTNHLQNVIAGTYTLTVTDQENCTSNLTVTLANVPGPTVALATITPVCINGGTINLSGGTPVGGTYSGPGVLGSIFDPVVVGAGTYNITYAYTDAFGCSGSAMKTLQVLALPVLSFLTLTSACVDAPVITLTMATPSGGTYSGTGVSAGVFNPATAGAGIHILLYTFTGPNGCTNEITQSITVNALPIVSLSPIPGTCINAPPQALAGGTPVGGTYSGTGVSGGMFSPASSGLGTFTITYVYKDGNLCISSAQQTILVSPTPNVTFNTIPNICLNAGVTPMQGGSPVGGIYSGVGVNNNLFSPAVTGTGTFQVFYNYSVLGCVGADTQTITVLPIPTASFPAVGELCVDAAPITLSGGLPSGGTYVGTGVNGTSFDPATSGAGTFSLGYAWSAANGCTDTAFQPMLVRPLPVITYTPIAGRCISDSPFGFSEATPTGGTYSGTGIVNGIFDPAAAGVGTYSILYTYTDPFGCTNNASRDLTINPLPLQVPLSGGGVICDGIGGMPVGLDSSQPGINYYLIVNGWVTLQAYPGTGAALSFGNQSAQGNYIVKAVDSITGCVNMILDTVHIKLLPKPVVNLGLPMYLCDLPQIVLDGGTYLDSVTYEWPDGSTNRYFNVFEPGNYWVKVYMGNCVSEDNIDIMDCSLLELPNIFTPNGDGKNERFKPKKTGEIVEYQIEIFNRWGNMVYQSDKLEEGWDGRTDSNGADCPDGVYFFVARYVAHIFPQPDTQRKLTGTVTLMR